MPLRLPNSSLVQVGGRQERLRCAFRIPGNHCYRAQSSVNPGDELQAPVGGIQANKARMDLIQLHSPCQKWLSKGSVMNIGRGKEKKEWQT